MRRKSVHAVFAVVSIVFAAYAGGEALKLARASHINVEVASLANAVQAPATVHSPAQLSSGSERVAATVATTHQGNEPSRGASREVRLAWAIALSSAKRYGEAANIFDALIEEGAPDAIGRAALFDSANMYLRQGAGDGADALRSLPLVDEAKARYRRLLRVAPDDWDARYNLERALRVAPETVADTDAGQGTTKRDIRLRGAKSEDLP
jgi:mxaK protein